MKTLTLTSPGFDSREATCLDIRTSRKSPVLIVSVEFWGELRVSRNGACECHGRVIPWRADPAEVAAILESGSVL